MYRSFTFFIEPELYLNVLTSKSLRITYSRFRLGLSDIMMNSGRQRSVPRQMRVYPFCPAYIEDEFHVLLVCTAYSSLREKNIPPKY